MKGISMQYPCENCGKLCIKNQIRALCSLECRLLGNIETKNGCWVWKGKKTVWGYGEIMLQAKRHRVHRVSFEYFNQRKIEEGKILCHVCDIRACINPKHLFEGTDAINSQDMVNKGRSSRGEKNMNAILYDDEVQKIKELLAINVNKKDIARIYSITISHLYKIMRNESWNHISTK